MRTWRTLASLRIHPPSGYVRRMILMMNHPNLMCFSASVGDRGVLMFGGASQYNGAENVAENATILWPVAPLWQKVQQKMQCNGQKKSYTRSLLFLGWPSCYPLQLCTLFFEGIFAKYIYILYDEKCRQKSQSCKKNHFFSSAYFLALSTTHTILISAYSDCGHF